MTNLNINLEGASQVMIDSFTLAVPISFSNIIVYIMTIFAICLIIIIINKFLCTQNLYCFKLTYI